MKLLVLALFIGALMLSPLVVFDAVVMPEILALHETYASADETAAAIAAQ